jgi:branched-chain amino acid aminotransferase
VPIEAKVAANYMNGIMANRAVQKRGFDLGIMLDTEGFVAEGGTESLFLVLNDTVVTPSLGTVLQAITRKSILEAAASVGIATAEKRIRPDMLMEADELFVSSTSRKITPVAQAENRSLDPVPGPVTARLMTLFQEICAGRDARFRHWLFPVNRE